MDQNEHENGRQTSGAYEKGQYAKGDGTRAVAEQYDPDDSWFSWNVGRALGAAAFVLMAVMWTLLFIRGRGVAHPDEMNFPNPDDRVAVAEATDEELAALQFVTEADAICADTQAFIATLPSAAGADTTDERAELVEIGTARLEEMIQDLNRIDLPLEAKERSIAAEWLVDYDRFLDDRWAYAERLRSGDDGPFTVSAKAGEGRRLSDYVVNFAEVNTMWNCVPPGDV